MSIVISPAAPVITTASPLADGETGIAYSQILSVTGGTAPFSWAVTAGALPDGLTLDAATAEISGICTVAGVYTFTVEVTDSQATPATDAKVFEITVNAGADTDGDGLPDSWEINNFGNLDQGAYDDPDDDGWYNITEFVRGWDPNVQNNHIPDLSRIKAHPRLWMRADNSNPFVPSVADVSAKRTGGYSAEWDLVRTSSVVWNQGLTYLLSNDPVKLTAVKSDACEHDDERGRTRRAGACV